MNRGQRHRSRPGRAILLIGLLTLMVLAVAGIVVGSRLQSPDDAAARADPPEPSYVTAPVEFRVLSSTVVTRGDVRAARRVGVPAPSSVEGRPVVTGVFVRAGDQVAAGDVLFEISSRPAIALQGNVAVYRELRPGLSGRDVAGLRAALKRWGCDTSPDRRNFYGAATKQCVDELYTAGGYAPIATTSTEKADLTRAESQLAKADVAVTEAETVLESAQAPPSDEQLSEAQTNIDQSAQAFNIAVAQADHLLSQAELDASLAQSAYDRVVADPKVSPSRLERARLAAEAAHIALEQQRLDGEVMVASAGGAMETAQAAYDELGAPPDVSAEYIALGRAIERRDGAHRALVKLQMMTGPTVPVGEIVFVERLPGVIESVRAQVGSSGSGSNALCVLSSGELQVHSSISSSDIGLVREGMAVELLNESKSQSRNGVVTSLTPRASDLGPEGRAHAIRIESKRPLPQTWSGLNVRVTVTAAATDSEVLVVPIASVSAGVDGQERLQVLQDQSGEPVVVPVDAGLSAGGYVEVRPAHAEDLRVGDQVVIGE